MLVSAAILILLLLILIWNENRILRAEFEEREARIWGINQRIKAEMVEPTNHNTRISAAIWAGYLPGIEQFRRIRR